MGLLNSRSAMHSFECMPEEGRKEGRKEENEINYACCCYSNRSQLLRASLREEKGLEKELGEGRTREETKREITRMRRK